MNGLSPIKTKIDGTVDREKNQVNSEIADSFATVFADNQELWRDFLQLTKQLERSMEITRSLEKEVLQKNIQLENLAKQIKSLRYEPIYTFKNVCTCAVIITSVVVYKLVMS
jgi:hypothetical protein